MSLCSDGVWRYLLISPFSFPRSIIIAVQGRGVKGLYSLYRSQCSQWLHSWFLIPDMPRVSCDLSDLMPMLHAQCPHFHANFNPRRSCFSSRISSLNSLVEGERIVLASDARLLHKFMQQTYDVTKPLSSRVKVNPPIYRTTALYYCVQ